MFGVWYDAGGKEDEWDYIRTVAYTAGVVLLMMEGGEAAD